MSRGHASYRAQPGPLRTHAAGGLKERDLLPNEAAERARAGDPVDFMVVGSARADLATPYARHLIGQTIYVVGRVSIMA